MIGAFYPVLQDILKKQFPKKGWNGGKAPIPPFFRTEAIDVRSDMV